MNKNLGAFSVALIMLAALIGLVTTRFFHPSFLLLILGVLAGATWLAYFLVQKTKPSDFVKNYSLTIVLKLLAGGIFISPLLYIDKEGANANAIFFMITYFLLTGLEVTFLFRQVGKSNR